MQMKSTSKEAHKIYLLMDKTTCKIFMKDI